MTPQGNGDAGALFRGPSGQSPARRERGGKSEIDRREKQSPASPSPCCKGLLVAVVIVVVCVCVFSFWNR